MLLKRTEIDYLRSWASRATRKPLIIRGARQVGKSTLVRQFAQASGLELVALNFERNPEFREVFARRDPAEILAAIQLLTGKAVRTGAALLFLDEIQAAPEGLAALRYFQEETPDLHVIAAGSLLEFALATATFSMPVGRVEYLYLGPMQFEDFLQAMGETPLVEWLRSLSLGEIRAGPMTRAVHEKLMGLLRQYWITGGLPEAVARFTDSRDFSEVSRVHHSIVSTYRDDFAKYSHGALRERVQLVFDRLPALVGRKFKYAHVSHDHRAAELATALEQLCMARIAYKVHHTSANGVPLGAEVNDRHFKVLYMDVGLMATALQLRLIDLGRQELTMINSGAVAEQFVGQHLLYAGLPYEAPALHYWFREAKGASAEVDYVITHGQHVVPIEIKSGKTGTLRSLHYFLQEKRRGFAVRLNGDVPSLLEDSSRLADGVELEYSLLSLPLYAVGQIGRLLDTKLEGAEPHNPR